MATQAPDTVEATLKLAKALSRLSVYIFGLLDAEPNHPEAIRLRNLERNLDNAVNTLTGKAIKFLGDDVSGAVAHLKAVSEKAEIFIKKIDSAKRAIKIATTLLGLAAAAVVGDVEGVLGAIGTVEKAMSDADTVGAAKDKPANDGK
jgi:hypothetical protein